MPLGFKVFQAVVREDGAKPRMRVIVVGGCVYVLLGIFVMRLGLITQVFEHIFCSVQMLIFELFTGCHGPRNPGPK
jgi:hypothetical protein